MITIDLEPETTLLHASEPHGLFIRRNASRAVAVCSLFMFVGLLARSEIQRQPPGLANVRRASAAPEEKKFTMMPMRFGVNPSITTSGNSITMSPDIAVEGGFLGWEGDEESYGDSYESNVVGPDAIGERGAQMQGEAFSVDEKPLGETAAIVGGGVTATASAIDHATATTMVTTWEAPGKVVGAELWAARAAADLAFSLVSPTWEPSMPPMPPGLPPSPPTLPPLSPPPIPPSEWWWG